MLFAVAIKYLVYLLKYFVPAVAMKCFEPVSKGFFPSKVKGVKISAPSILSTSRLHSLRTADL